MFVAGGMPGGAGGMPDINDLFKDPELMAAMQVCSVYLYLCFTV